MQLAQLVKRTGWVRKGIEGPESIADHMYRMGVMAMIVDDDSVNANRRANSMSMLPQIKCICKCKCERKCKCKSKIHNKRTAKP